VHYFLFDFFSDTPVHGSRASPRTGLRDLKFETYPFGLEHVEGLRTNCDTVSLQEKARMRGD
jgi:hypothetical protein